MEQLRFISRPLRPGAAVEPYRAVQLEERPEFADDVGKVGIIGLFNSEIQAMAGGFASEEEFRYFKIASKLPLYPFQTVPTILLAFSSITEIQRVEEVSVCSLKALLFRPGTDRERSFRAAMWGILQYMESKFFYRSPEDFQTWKAGWVSVYDRYDRVLMFDLLHNGQFIFGGSISSWTELDPKNESTFVLSLYVDLLLLLMRDFNVDPGQILYSFYLLYPGARVSPIRPGYPARILEATPFDVFGY